VDYELLFSEKILFGRRARQATVQGSLFLWNLFRFLWSHLDLVLIFSRLFEVSDSFSNSFTDLGELSSAKNDQDDDQDDNQLRHSYSEHFFLLLRKYVELGGSAWESNPPRTSPARHWI
jgi:hypothetical protein